MQGFEVLHGGIYSVIQDLGRYGYAHRGITPSGAMDEYAYRWSQKLLDNGLEANAIEVLLGGVLLKAHTSTTISVCGADLGFCINNKPMPIWRTYNIQKGDTIHLKQHKTGMRAYIAVKGGFKIAKIEGSYATTLREAKGKQLKQGDFLPCKEALLHESRRVKERLVPTYTKRLTLRLIPSYQHTLFEAECKEKFFTQHYRLSSQINAMGYRLEGEPLDTTLTNIISEGIGYGAVQIPQDGQPIILLKERQTIGGYPKMGTLLPLDAFRLAQMPIGATLTFESIELAKAQAKMRKFYTMFISTPTNSPNF